MNSVEFYTQRGFDLRTAEYFASGRRTITDVIAQDDFSLLLSFDNGEKRRFDMRPVIRPGTVFAFLEKPEHFRRVYLEDCSVVSWDVDPEIDSNVVWNNKVDISADACYLDSIPVEEREGR